MPWRTRRWVLRAGGVTGLLLSAGCLRLSNPSERQDISGDTSTPTTTPPTDGGSETATAAAASSPTRTSSSASTASATDTATAAPAGSDPTSSAWETTADGDADANVDGPAELDFRVFRCATASATRGYETQASDVTISFDYEVEADEWFEAPYLIVRDGGETVYESRNKGVDDKTFRVERSGTTRGSFERTVPVSGSFTLELGIRPSDYCSNGDHGNTYFRVSNLTVE